MTLTIISLVIASICSAGGPSIADHGLGFLQRVRNNSAYPIEFAQSKTILDYLPDGTVIRLRSLRKDYGTTGRYYAVRKIVGAYRLEADTIDPDDKATHLTIKRFIAPDYSEYIGIYSDAAEGQYMQTDETRAVTFSLQDMMDNQYTNGHWSVTDANGNGGAISDKKFLDPNFAANIFNNCFLQSRASGALQSRGTPQNYPGVNNAPHNPYANPMLTGIASSTTQGQAGSSASSNANTSINLTQDSNNLGSPAANTSPATSITALGTVTTLTQTKCSMVSNAKAIVALTQTGSAIRQKSDGSWEALNQGLNGATLTSISAGNDGTVWACDKNNNVWAYDSSQSIWGKIIFSPSTGTISKVVVANASNIWALSTDGKIFQKSGSNSNTLWQPPSPAPGSGIVSDLCIASDGALFVICNDNKIYRGVSSSSGYTFSQFASPQDMMKIPPYAIAAGSSSFVAFSSPGNDVYVLVKGKSGNTSDSWKKLTQPDKTTGIKLNALSANSNNSLAGIVSDGGQPDDSSVILVSNITTT